MPLCKRTNQEVHMVYETKKYFDKFDTGKKNFKFCEFWDTKTGNCSKDHQKCQKGKPIE
jgi:hypothetical protein